MQWHHNDLSYILETTWHKPEQQKCTGGSFQGSPCPLSQPLSTLFCWKCLVKQLTFSSSVLKSKHHCVFDRYVAANLTDLKVKK